jgi:hypothetical protein
MFLVYANLTLFMHMPRLLLTAGEHGGEQRSLEARPDRTVRGCSEGEGNGKERQGRT